MGAGASGSGVLAAMITPAILMLACGTLITSTATRLARIVDRVRQLSNAFDQLTSGQQVDFVEERLAEVERQLAAHVQRSRLIQGSLTSFYVSLGIFVATSLSLALVAFLPSLAGLSSALGLVGTLVLFYGCVLLIRETRLALTSVNSEMAFVLSLRERHGSRRNGR
jgi:uncharacterized protein DUF2721